LYQTKIKEGESAMDYTLSSDERVIIESKTHWAAFAVPPASILVGILIAVLSVMLRTDQSAPCIWWLAVIGVIAFLNGTTGILPSLEHPRTEFVLTNKRILANIGLLRHRSMEMFLPEVKGVEVTTPLAGRLAGYGTIIVDTGNKKKEFFYNIAQAVKLKEEISSAITKQG
jgi:hypothetical protein